MAKNPEDPIPDTTAGCRCYGAILPAEARLPADRPVGASSRRLGRFPSGRGDGAAIVAALAMAGTLFVMKSGLIPHLLGHTTRNQSEQLTYESWTTFKKNEGKPRAERDKKEYHTAIARANLCIKEFKGAAERIEAKLVAGRAETPTGRGRPGRSRAGVREWPAE